MTIDFSKSSEFDKSTYTTPCDLNNLAGHTAGLGDIVASGIEPTTPVGRIVAFVHRKPTNREWFGTVVVTTASGEVRRGSLGIGWVGYCKRDDWDGPTPNGLGDLVWRR